MKTDILNHKTTAELLALLGLMKKKELWSSGLFIIYYLLFNKLYLFKDIGSDTLNTFYPEFVHNSEILLDFKLPWWSFQQGLGQNIFSSAGLGNPFKLVLYLFGRENIPYVIVYVEAIKFIMAGFFFIVI